MAKQIWTDANVATAERRHGQSDTVVRGEFGIRGLALRIGARRKQWFVLIERAPRVYKVLGEFPAVSVEMARKLTLDIVAKHRDGKPIEEIMGDTPDINGKPAAASINSTWLLYRDRMKDDGKSPLTIAGYEHSLKAMSAEIKSRPLRDLANDRTLMEAEVALIKHKSKGRTGGASTATKCARLVSSLFNFAKDRDTTLVGDPVSAVQTVDPVREQPRLAAHEMPAWYARVLKIRNPVTRWALLFALFSGLRRASFESLERDNIDRENMSIKVTTMKNKKAGDRPFEVILSPVMLHILDKAIEAGAKLFPKEGQRWVFPGQKGHITAACLTDLQKCNVPIVVNHALRRAFADMAMDAGVDEAMIGRLMGHGAKSITARYIKDSHVGKMLAAVQADVSASIVKALGNPPELALGWSPEVPIVDQQPSEIWA